MIIDGKQLGTVGLQKIGTPYSEMDCQAFVEWCLKQCGCDMNLAGSNAWYREVMKNGAIMTPEECVKQLGTVPAGAFLFILDEDGGEPEKYKGDGLGNASHIGIATGTGEGAIHSSASRGGVYESKFRNKSIAGGWNRVGLWDRVSYDYGSGPSADPDPAPVPEPVPVKQYAFVWSDNDLPVNTRKGPGKEYAQSKAGKLPVGSLVEILKASGEWRQIRCTDQNGAVWICWIHSHYLKAAGEEDPQVDPPEDDFNPGDMAGNDDRITLYLVMSREEATQLLQIVDRLQWNLVQIIGRG